MATVGQIFTGILLLVWFVVPMVVVMGLGDDPTVASPPWDMIVFLAALTLYPILIGLVYFAMSWRFFALSPGVFFGAVSILPVLLGVLVFPGIVSDKLSGRDRRIEIKDGTVIANGEAVPGADPATFTLFVDRYYGKDKAHVFYQGKIMEGVDPAKFRPFEVNPGEQMYRDDQSVFYGANRVAVADPDSFRLISFAYFRDRNHGFALKQPQQVIVVLEGADPETLQLVDSGPNSETLYAKDKNAVYYGGKRIEGADPATFEFNVGEGSNARDRNTRYLNGVPVGKR